MLATVYLDDEVHLRRVAIDSGGAQRLLAVELHAQDAAAPTDASPHRSCSSGAGARAASVCGCMGASTLAVESSRCGTAQANPPLTAFAAPFVKGGGPPSWPGPERLPRRLRPYTRAGFSFDSLACAPYTTSATWSRALCR